MHKIIAGLIGATVMVMLIVHNISFKIMFTSVKHAV